MRTLAVTMKGLGPDWDDARLEEFDLSLAVRQEISEHGERLRDASAEYSSRRSRLGQDRAALVEAIDAESKAQLEFEASMTPGLDAEQILQQRNLARATKAQLDEIGRQRQNVRNLQTQLDGLESAATSDGAAGGARTVAAISLVFGFGLLIAGGVLGGTTLYIGAAAGIALVSVGIYLFVSRKSGPMVAGESPIAGPIRESLRRAEADIEDLQSRMMQDAMALGLELIDESSLLAAEAFIDEQEGKLRERTRLNDALDGAKDLVKQRQTRAEESAAGVEDAERQLDAAQREWNEWLSARGLLEPSHQRRPMCCKVRSNLDTATLKMCEAGSSASRPSGRTSTNTLRLSSCLPGLSTSPSIGATGAPLPMPRTGWSS